MIDFKLIEECRRGDLRNFGKVVEASGPFALSVAYKMLGDEELAKDVVQETMITIWEKIGKIKSSDLFRTWLYRIVVNKCYDEFRKSKRIKEVRADESIWKKLSSSLADHEISDLNDRELAALISGLTEKLSPRQKMIFVLSELEGMNSSEIAEITGMSKANIKANLCHARNSIREMLSKYL